jgi:protein-L-isoaspartate(D-aspartate) O-methyltransferase
MLMQSPSERLRRQLVTSLQERGALRSQSVALAFLAVPREQFIHSFYEPVGRAWTLHSETTEQDWLELVYQDDALVTRLDAQNIPISSSSQPSLMAAMLESLDVQLGQRILEIGTGTGYNAALLAKLTGDPALVTTVEIDEEIADRARIVLSELVGEVVVQVGDGSLGIPSRMPYDRIIATASASALPRLWYEQLVSGGQLVMPLQGSLQAGGFLVVQKSEKEGQGQFQQPPLSFMAMRSPEQKAFPSYAHLFQQPVTGEVYVEKSDPLLVDLREPSFRWFLQWAWPPEGQIEVNPLTLPDGRRALLIKDIQFVSILQLTQQAHGSWFGSLHGDFLLWQTIRRIYQSYQTLGQPGQERFQVHLDSQRAKLVVFIGDEVVCLRDLYG